MERDLGECVVGVAAVYVPPWMAGTALGDRLAERTLSDDWARVVDADIDYQFKTPVPLAGLQKQDRLLFPEQHQPAAQRRICAQCGIAATRKCSVCLSVYYCCRACQEAGWRDHKQICEPYRSGTEVHLAIALPDFRVSYSYLEWLHSTPHVPGTVDPAIVARDTFVEMYGEANLKRTFFHMAVFGKPACLVMRIGARAALLTC